jgi:CRP-like cAMP-binding protein
MDRATWNDRDLVLLLSRLKLFSHLAGPLLESLAGRCRLERWAEGDRIIRQGDQAEDYYVLLEGRGSVTVDGRVVTELRPGDQFGEIALLHDVPRSADVVAVSPAVTLSLHRDDFLPALRDRFLSG